jgi:hypothetical protein
MRAEPERCAQHPTNRRQTDAALETGVFTIILLLYLQQNLEVTLEGSSLRGVYATRAECEATAVRLRGPLPTPLSYAAAWHDALCLPINREVRVKELAPLDLRHLFERPPPGCGADGAWRRLAQLCVPAEGGKGAAKGGD